jgi:hypothetical protein
LQAFALSKKRKKRKDYAFRRQINEKPSIIPGCLDALFQHMVTMRAVANSRKAGGWSKSSFEQSTAHAEGIDDIVQMTVISDIILLTFCFLLM